jgi:hypothetical protein
LPEHPRHHARSGKPEKLRDRRHVRYCVEAPQHRQGGVSALARERVMRQGTKLFLDLGVASALRQIPGLAAGISRHRLAIPEHHGYPRPVLDRNAIVGLGEFRIGDDLDFRQQRTQFPAPKPLV